MIGNRILELDRVDSTNAYAGKLLARSKLGEGDVIWAHDQYAGRGQHDHSWSSEPGRNLTVTVVFRPVFLDPGHQFLLNKAVSLAVVDYICRVLPLDHELRIKWPNDIYLDNRKAGGILIEHKIMGNVLDTSLVGIGLNVNQMNFHDDVPNPISLIYYFSKETDLKEALMSLCRHLDRRYSSLKESGSGGIDRDYDQYLLGFGQWRKFTRDGKKLDGRIVGVNDPGQLLVETKDGRISPYNHREIEYIL